MTEPPRPARPASVERLADHGHGARTRVVLADGYRATFVGRISKSTAIRNAIYQRDVIGHPSEAAS